MNIEIKAQPRTILSKIPRGVWALGVVSMFMDISTEMIHGLLPVFLVSVLGASTAMVGLIEGVGEATASISKLFSGWLSDKLGKRKALTIIGYGLGALSKPLVASRPRLRSSSPRAFPTGSEKAFAARLATRSSATWCRRVCAARPTVCGKHSTPWAPSPGH